MFGTHAGAAGVGGGAGFMPLTLEITNARF